MRNFAILILFLVFSSANNIRNSDQTYVQLEKYLNSWGKKYFRECFEKRTFKKVNVLYAEWDDSALKINGKVYYEYGLLGEQSRDFTATITVDKTIFSKESRLRGKEECKTSTLSIGKYLFD